MPHSKERVRAYLYQELTTFCILMPHSKDSLCIPYICQELTILIPHSGDSSCIPMSRVNYINATF